MQGDVVDSSDVPVRVLVGYFTIPYPTRRPRDPDLSF
jgi:hypothetical protein